MEKLLKDLRVSVVRMHEGRGRARERWDGDVAKATNAISANMEAMWSAKDKRDFDKKKKAALASVPVLEAAFKALWEAYGTWSTAIDNVQQAISAVEAQIKVERKNREKACKDADALNAEAEKENEKLRNMPAGVPLKLLPYVAKPGFAGILALEAALYEPRAEHKFETSVHAEATKQAKEIEKSYTGVKQEIQKYKFSGGK